MKQSRPYYWLIGLAGLFFLVAALALFSLRIYGSSIKGGIPVEPHPQNADSSLFELWFTGESIYDLSVDRNVTAILFSSSNDKVSLLDREKKLRWDKSFSAAPLQVKISLCGSYLAVGTADGKLYFMSTDQQLWWEAEGDPVYRVAVSANGQWVVAGRGRPDQEEHVLELYSRDGTLQWSIDTGPLLKVHLSGEQPERGRLFFSTRQDDSVSTVALDMEGTLLWSHDGESLADISLLGSRLAAVAEDKLRIYNYPGELLWEEELSFTVEKVMFNPQNYGVLLYGTGDESGKNLYSFSADGELLWKNRIADGSLFSFTADGRHIITGSWRHYKDDYTQMVLYSRDGVELDRWDVAMRVEHLVVMGNRRYIILGSEDGYIETVDLEAEFGRKEGWPSPAASFYNPVTGGGNGQKVSIWFSGESEVMVPVSRSISDTEEPLRGAITAMVRGPARDTFLYRTFPKDAEIEVRFLEEEGRLFLNISPELAALAGTAQSIAALDSLLLTLAGFPEVREVFITVAGEQIETFGDGLLLEQPLTPYRWKQPVFIPVRSGERYYLVPREARDLEIEQRDLDGLLRAVLRICRTFYFIPGDLFLVNVDETTDTVKINLNQTLRQLFPETGGEEEHLLAALLLDALFVTALENSTARRIEILVEGESWSPPEGYPDLSRTFSQPYFINPE